MMDPTEHKTSIIIFVERPDVVQGSAFDHHPSHRIRDTVHPRSTVLLDADLQITGYIFIPQTDDDVTILNSVQI
jgi:hypothetical protein